MIDRHPATSEADDDPLDALFHAARRAPMPPAAARLAIGFGARMEARMRALSETQDATQFVWRWLTGLGLCAAVALAAAGTLDRSGVSAHSPQEWVSESPMQSAWDEFTALPQAWPEQ